MKMSRSVKFIDLFAGMGGIRIGLEKSFQAEGFETECVMTSEIKAHAIQTLKANFKEDKIVGDISKIPSDYIPDFDFLLAGFPCQPFSAGGKRLGFVDRRGTLFFEIERILRDKKPMGFILENVEGLVRHDLEDSKDKIGRTLRTILQVLEHDLDYKVSWRVLDALDFGLPQSRKRVFIVGMKNEAINLDNFPVVRKKLVDIMEQNLETMQTPFVEKILSKYAISDLYGKSIKDKRGGENNIHSWDIELRGSVSKDQRQLLNKLFKERRKKKWAAEIGIHWMDGMPLTLEQINTFYPHSNLKSLLNDLVKKGYLRFEHPKELQIEQTENGLKKYRAYDESKPKGYNIVTGKLSFEINKILDPNDIAPTIVATDAVKIAVPDGQGLRRISEREGLRLFGYPEHYNIPCSKTKAFDLLGNTVAVTVVEAITRRIAEKCIEKNYFTDSLTPVLVS